MLLITNIWGESVSFKFVIFTNIMMESFRKPNIVYRIEP